uniref:SWIM-type domain-containing protein n=1 Tax=Desulfovibrio sp. U5L TaxID=596152 RepID=I2Q4F2_9BACT
MPNPLSRQPHFKLLAWDDLVIWAGSKVATRGRGYQREGQVKDLAETAGGGLIAPVDGSERYLVQIRMDGEGRLESHCICPYTFDCKHGVVAVLEYLVQVAKDSAIPEADPQDPRLTWTSGDENDGADEDRDPDEAYGMALPPDVLAQVDALLVAKTKVELIDLIHGFMEKYPKVASELQDTIQLRSGDNRFLVDV